MLKQQLARFAVAGLIGFLVDAGGLYLASMLGAGLYLGRALSFLCAVFVTWQINRNLTFAAAHGTPPHSLWAEWWRYLSSMTLGGAINLSIYTATLHLAPSRSWTPLLGVALGTGVAMVGNFLFSKFWVFRHKQ